MGKIHIAAVLLVLLLFAGCTIPGQNPPGSDRDEHGCIPSAGYSWCEAKQKCIRNWEENCTTTIVVGNDSDEHGCIGSAGYTWCEAMGKCIRIWEENCTASILVGNDSDEHGCKGSAGYSWCEEKQKCIRIWEENCSEVSNSTINPEAETFGLTLCGKPNVDSVYVCSDYVRSVSTLLGGGSTFYRNGAIFAQCPVVAPDSMSAQCKSLVLESTCEEKKIC